MSSAIGRIFERHGFIVSRETLDRLDLYEQLLQKWQKAVNLIGPATVDDIPNRHFYDSAQVFRYIPDIDVRLVDMGSGAGFPGLVLAILGVKDVHLIESDVRKATFLREVSRETNAPVTIHDKRVEDCVIANIDVFTARALAPLKDLLGYVDKLRTPGHENYALFMKGMQYQEEIDKAEKAWNFNVETFDSQTDLAAKIIKINNLTKK